MKAPLSIRDLQSLTRVAETFATRLTGRDLIILTGPMGVGKTRFTQELVKALGGREAVTSPTFSLHNQYQTPRGTVDHLDLYRIESESEMESSGFWDLFTSQLGCIIVEWGERVSERRLPRSWCLWRITLYFDEKSERWLLIECSSGG